MLVFPNSNSYTLQERRLPVNLSMESQLAFVAVCLALVVLFKLSTRS
jgi:hypothetical protein